MRPKLLKQRDIHNPSNQIQGLDDERELSNSSTSTIIIDCEYFPPSIIDHFDEIYTHRYHKQCINLTYLTLLSMTCAVLFWMIYWMSYEYCQRFLSIEEMIFTCRTVFIFQVLIFFFVGLSPILFILMVIYWMIFACSNPIDKIRNDFIGIQLEGITWKKQLDYYFKTKTNCFQFRSRKRHKLFNRNSGYIILSPYGIIFDELFLLNSHKNLFINGILNNNERILKLKLNKYCTNEILIYLPEQIINQELIEIFRKLLKIDINTSSSQYF